MQRHRDNQIGVLVNYKLRPNYKTVRLIYGWGTDYYRVWYKCKGKRKWYSVKQMMKD